MNDQTNYPPHAAPPLRRKSILDVLPYLFFSFLIVWALRGWWQPVLHRLFPADPNARLAPDAVPRVVTPRGDLAADEATTIELFKASSRSVVFVSTSRLATDRFRLNVFERQQGTGTGFIWDNEGHVVTNHHVIMQGGIFRVMTADQRTYTAELVGSSASHDLAVLKVPELAESFGELPLGSSEDLEVGQKVFAIGNPFGLDQTLTTGIISGLGREIPVQGQPNTKIEGVIQTDAAINPGNSGGPLLDSSGRLIGVNTAIVSPSGAYAGVGFAIPVDTVNRIVPQLLRHGRVIQPILGITLLPHNQQLVERLRQNGVLSEAKGVLVLNVVPGSTAAEAGVRPMRRTEQGIEVGDLIVAINGTPIDKVGDLYSFLDRSQVGDEIVISVLRGLGTPDRQQVDLSGTLKGGPR